MGSGSASTTFSNRLNDVVNVAILVMLVLLGVRYVAGRASVSSMGYELGETVAGLPESVVTEGDQTLLLQVRSTCQYCSQAMPAYRRISEGIRAAQKAVRLVAITYEPAPACEEYLRLNSIVVDDVFRPTGSEPRLGVTPAILLVDSRRRVLGS